MRLQHLYIVFWDEAPLPLQLPLQPARLPRWGHCRRGHSVTRETTPQGGEGEGGGGEVGKETDRGHSIHSVYMCMCQSEESRGYSNYTATPNYTVTLSFFFHLHCKSAVCLWSQLLLEFHQQLQNGAFNTLF